MSSLTTAREIRVEITQHATAESSSDARWRMACQRFVAAVPEEMQQSVERALHSLHGGGFGLRTWVSSIAWRGGKMPEQIPRELLEVYLNDPEAIPLHDCESCGVAIPVRPNRIEGIEAEPEQIYFPSCPVCGGRTGWYLYVSRQLEGDELHGSGSSEFRRRKPR